MADYSHLGAVPVKKGNKDYSHLGAVAVSSTLEKRDNQPKRNILGNASIPERLKVAAQYGPVPAITGDTRKDLSHGLVDGAPEVYQATGNVVGSGLGAMAGNPGAGSAFGGSVGRGFGNVMRDIGYGKKPTMESFADGLNSGAVGELFGTGIAKTAEKAIPAFKKSAIRLVDSIIKPTGKLTEKSGEIAETAIREGLSGSKHNMLGQTYNKMGEAVKTVDDIIEKYNSREITAEKAFRYLDDLEKSYFIDGDSEAASYIQNTLKKDLIAGRDLMVPTFGEKETAQFVMGPASKSVTPQVTRVKGSKVSNKVVEPTFNESTGSYPDEVVTHRKFSENPEDIVALHNAGEGASPREIVSISPKESYGVRPRVLGPSTKQTVQTGMAPRKLKLTESQDMKRGQYQTLSRKKAGGGYSSETKSPEIEGRQEYARGLKESMEDVIPEENLAGYNARIGRLSDLSQALENRIPISDRQNILGLGDLILGGASFTDPRAIGALASRRLLGTDTAKMFGARRLYNAAKNGGALSTTKDLLSDRYSSPLAKALMSRAVSFEN